MKELSKQDRKRIDGYLMQLKEINETVSKRMIELAKISIWAAEHTPAPINPSEELLVEAQAKSERAQEILEEVEELKSQISKLNKIAQKEAKRFGITLTESLSYIK